MGLPSTVSWSVRVHDESYAGAATWEPWAYASAGTTLNVEVFDQDGVPVPACTDMREIVSAYWNDGGYTELEWEYGGCTLPTGSTGATVRFTLDAWATAMGFSASASTDAMATISSVQFRACTPTCETSACDATPHPGEGGDCYCDLACVSLGDCCVDAAEECHTASCEDRCGTHSVDGSCWCDEHCEGNFDCCIDFYGACPDV